MFNLHVRSFGPVKVFAVALALGALNLAGQPGQSGAQVGTAKSPEATAARPLTAMPYSPSLDVTSMDRSVDPCVDFYKFSCGGWQKNNPIPADQAAWSVYAKLANENQQFLWVYWRRMRRRRIGLLCSRRWGTTLRLA